MSRIGRQVLILLLPFLLSIAPGMGVRAAPIALTVMTQNLYVGADSDPLLEASDLATRRDSGGCKPFSRCWRTIFRRAPPRSRARFKAAGGPLLIGLQEASVDQRIRARPRRSIMLHILLKQLTTLGLNYTIVGTHTGTTVALAGFSVTDRDSRPRPDRGSGLHRDRSKVMTLRA